MRAPFAVSRGVLAIFIVIALMALVVIRTAYIVRIDQYAIVTQFGKPVRTVDAPGLYLRIPFVEEVTFLDRRILEWDDSPQEVITADKKRILINTFARWRIADPLKYFTVVKTEEMAQRNLDKILGRSVRDVVSAHTLDELVRDTNRKLTYSTETSKKEKKTIDIPKESGRTNIMGKIFGKSEREVAEDFGIELIDVQMKQLNYTVSAQRETIKEMIAEREVVVERYEAEGKSESEKIHGEIAETIANLQADANQKSMKLEGEGRAKAIAIKSAAFAEDPELFLFIETLRLYEESFDASTTMVLDSSHPLLQLMREPMEHLVPSAPAVP